MKRGVSALLLGFVVALAMAVVGVADPGDREKLQFNAADQAAARAATIRRADLTVGAWKGGPVKPDLSPPPSCPNYPVDLSSFVMTGAAETHWTLEALALDSEAQVFQTAQMVRDEWRIQVQTPAAVACYHSYTARAFAAAGVKLVSFKQIPFPHVAQHSTAFRLVASAAGQRVVTELVLLGRSRTEIGLSVSGLPAEQAAISTAARRYARILAGRIKA